MIEVKVLGVGCANCKTTQDLIEKVCEDNDIAINLEKIEDQVKIMEYGIMSKQQAHQSDGYSHNPCK
jgi:proteasome assembly chaperone (PAC2) family protein